jgi:hypothetical protein
MALRKLVRFTVIIDHLKVYDLLALCEGSALAGSLNIQPVKHGGEDENGGVKPVEGTADFMAVFVAQHPRFKTKEAIAAAEKVGMTKASIYARITKMVADKVLKRVGTAEYSTRGGSKKTRNKKGAVSVPERLVALIRSQQNGTGDGVPLASLKKAIKAAGMKPTGVGPALSALIKAKTITRPSPGHYRLSEG